MKIINKAMTICAIIMLTILGLSKYDAQAKGSASTGILFCGSGGSSCSGVANASVVSQ